MPTGPQLVVEGLAPDPQPYGLFSVAAVPVEDDPKFQLGVIWETEVPCTPANGYGVECENPSGVPLVIREGQDVVTTLPFAVYGTYRCKTFSKPLDEARARALSHLLGWEERSVERAILHGDLGNEPSFQGADVLTNDIVDVECATNLIEEWAAQNLPGVATIHSPRALGGSWASSDVASRVGDHLETLAGSLVVLGGGYDMDNVSPAGVPHDVNARWVYVTSRPRVFRSQQVFFTPSDSNVVNTENNDVTVVAHRHVVAGWDCDVAAVQVRVCEEGES